MSQFGEMPALNRRALLKTAVASTALAVPAGVNGETEEVAAIRSSRSDQKGGKEQAMSESGLSKPRLKHIHEVMSGYVDRGEIPGIVSLVSRRGEIHVDAVGKKAIDDKEPIRRDTIFRIASMSKPVVAVAAMILAEECKLRLDEPVDRLLPELANRKVLKRLDSAIDDTEPANRSITVRDLLTFRLGFGVLMAPPGTYPIQKAATDLQIRMGPPHPHEQPAPDEWIRRLGTLPLMCQPGTKWLYDTGSDVLSVLVARAAGQPLETFLRERIFDPLGMKDTGFSVPAGKIDRLATAYFPHPKTGSLALYDKAEGGDWSRPPAFPSGAGGLVSTIDDYLAFGQMMLNKGKYGNERILSRPSVEAMVSDQLTAEQKRVSGLVSGYFDSHGWGLGLSVVTRRADPTAPVGTFGWDGGLGTSWYTDPQEEMVTILLTQRCWTAPVPPDVQRDFLTLAYQAIDD